MKTLKMIIRNHFTLGMSFILFGFVIAFVCSLFLFKCVFHIFFFLKHPVFGLLKHRK